VICRIFGRQTPTRLNASIDINRINYAAYTFIYIYTYYIHTYTYIYIRLFSGLPYHLSKQLTRPGKLTAIAIEKVDHFLVNTINQDASLFHCYVSLPEWSQNRKNDRISPFYFGKRTSYDLEMFPNYQHGFNNLRFATATMRMEKVTQKYWGMAYFQSFYC